MLLALRRERALDADPGGCDLGRGVFAWKDYPTLWKALDGKLGAYLRAQISKAGLEAMEKAWDNGFRQVTTSIHPIVHPEDFKGLKIRVPISALWTSLFQSLGASPASINFSEVYSALQTKVVDAQENLPAIISAKLYEVQKYCVMTSHMWDGWWFLMNGRAWHQMPPDLQEVFARVINDAALAERADVEKQNGALKEFLSQKELVSTTSIHRRSTRSVPALASTRRGRTSSAPRNGRCWRRRPDRWAEHVAATRHHCGRTT